MFGIAVGCISAELYIALLCACRHACGRTGALNIKQHHGYFGVIGKTDKLAHQGNAGARGWGKTPRPVPCRTNDHTRRRKLVFGLGDAIFMFAGFRMHT